VEIGGRADDCEIERVERRRLDVGIAFGDVEELRRFGAASGVGLDDREVGATGERVSLAVATADAAAADDQ